MRTTKKKRTRRRLCRWFDDHKMVVESLFKQLKKSYPEIKLERYQPVKGCKVLCFHPKQKKQLNKDLLSDLRNDKWFDISIYPVSNFRWRIRIYSALCSVTKTRKLLQKVIKTVLKQNQEIEYYRCHFHWLPRAYYLKYSRLEIELDFDCHPRKSPIPGGTLQLLRRNEKPELTNR